MDAPDEDKSLTSRLIIRQRLKFQMRRLLFSGACFTGLVLYILFALIMSYYALIRAILPLGFVEVLYVSTQTGHTAKRFLSTGCHSAIRLIIGRACVAGN